MTPEPSLPKTKKSVALSGVVAGNTAICTVGHTGNDLHYRGYDIAEVATHATFEEVAYLLIHERLPNAAELTAYREKLKKLRGLPVPLRNVLEQIPAGAHPMDVLRTGCSMLGNLEQEKLPSAGAGAPSAPARGKSGTASLPPSPRCSCTGIISRAPENASWWKPR